MMLVAGWADGYRNNTFRTVAALARGRRAAPVAARPVGHMSTETSLPGPRIDLVPEMARWWDRWLRGIDNGVDDEPTRDLVRPQAAHSRPPTRHRSRRVACRGVAVARVGNP